MTTIESRQQVQLARMRRIALALLLLMGALLVAGRALRAAQGPWRWIAAFAEAAMVGGLADWFAVSALFRHPLGLPIPHTAIIPNNKERIGESIGNFLQNNFLTHEVLREELQHVDFAGAAAHWLADGAHSAAVARQLVQALPPLLRTIDAQQARALLERVVVKRVRRLAAGAGAGAAARPAGRGAPASCPARTRARDRGARSSRTALSSARKCMNTARAGCPGRSTRNCSSASWKACTPSCSKSRPRTASGARFDQAVDDMLDQLATSPAHEERLQALLARAARNEGVHAYLAQLWHALTQRVLADLARDDSAIAARAALALRSLGQALQDDPAIRDRLNGWLRSVVAATIVDRREVISAVVWRVIRSWDTHTVTRKFELQVGKDLQFIRINGTLVGGLLGVLLHALAGAFPA
ncbi:DUF445 domain-containing protein [Massilia sp. B-10]|nr:DUF445 domain-containing protein [Massilia sp. B-10]